MGYILDSSVLIYMLESFPRKASKDLWNLFEQSCETKETISVNEAKKMLENYELAEPTSHDWLKDKSHIFQKITQKDAEIITNIVERGHFDKYVDSEEFIRKLPYSLPFTVSKAIAENLTLVVDKKSREFEFTKKICENFGILVIETQDYLVQLLENTI